MLTHDEVYQENAEYCGVSVSEVCGGAPILGDLVGISNQPLNYNELTSLEHSLGLVYVRSLRTCISTHYQTHSN